MGESSRVSLKLSILVGIILAAGIVGSFWYFSHRVDPREIEIKNLREMIARLEVERRVAEVVVVDQKKGPNGRIISTRFRFAETAPGRPTISREFDLEGDVAFFDALVVKFDRAFTKLGDPTRGHSLYLFRRVFGDYLEPSKGYPLDPFDERGVPAAYRLREVPSEFEREVWRDFWDLALDPPAAQEKGIRALHGDVLYTRLVPGKIYRLMIEDAGGLSLQIEDAPALKPPVSPGS